MSSDIVLPVLDAAAGGHRVSAGWAGCRMPSRVVDRLNGLRQMQLARVSGDVLDLNLTGSQSIVEQLLETGDTAQGSLDSGTPDGTNFYRSARFDYVFGVAALANVADLARFLSGVAGLLRPDGQIWLIEPAYHPGLVSAALNTLWANHRSVRGLHIGRNLAATVRSIGFTITDLERLTMPTSVRPLKTFLSIRAARFGK